MTENEQAPSFDDVLAALKGRGGQECERQARVFLALWGLRQDDPNLETFRQAELGRQLGMARQAVNQAMRALRRKGFVVFGTAKVETTVPIVKLRRVVTLTIPLPEQMTLPFARPAPSSLEATA